MKFLLDENMPPSLAAKMISIGYAARHVIEIGYNSTPDFKICDLAALNDEIILTHDTDFGTILALSGAVKPSVILFRWQVITLNTVFQFLEKYLIDLKNDLNEGCLVVVDDNKMRVRLLPFKR